MIEIGAAALVAAAVLEVAVCGAGPLPALGPAFNPRSGVWASAEDARPAAAETIRLSGLRSSVDVVLESNGVPHIRAGGDLDLFRTLGYLHARFRLFQMDLLRREGEGKLSEAVGRAALDNDRLELQLGLARTAAMEWSMAPPATRAVVEAYTAGVNAGISEQLKSGRLPMLFRLLGYQPAPWQPLDSYVIKGVMTQDLDFQTSPLSNELLVRGLGPQRTMAWVPILPPNEQHPYDQTPHPGSAPTAMPALPVTVSAAQEATATALLDRLRRLPDGVTAAGGNSNNWTVGASRSANGHAMLAGDPHLGLTLPAIWYQVAGDSPGYSFTGVSIPGTPGVVIGRNQHIAWSLTNTENQATFYYQEKTDPAHPDQYFWNGAWRKFEHQRYSIHVKGGSVASLDVRISVHGPVITQMGLTYSVYWLGNLPSPDFDVLRAISRARDFAGFRAALQDWHAPSQNFAYADDQGHIGLISAGWYPQVKQGQPWLPMPGTGEYDVVGSIPFDQVPQVYDPPEGFTFSANQREVGAGYPYYIGTTLTHFDAGYRASEIHRVLSAGQQLTMADMEALQNDDRDYLAGRLVPVLLDAFVAPGAGRPDAIRTRALGLLAGWDDVMRVDSAAATIWATFLDQYRDATFGPWFRAGRVKLTPQDVSTPLIEDLEAWSLTDPGNPAFTPPGGPVRSAADVMRIAFAATLEQLSAKLGPDPARWQWGLVHQRQIRSLALLEALGYGPLPSRGDRFTPDAAPGSVSRSGPSARLIVDFGGASVAIVPGGQSENPVASWYEDRVAIWWKGLYQPMLGYAQARRAASSVVWTMRP